jgi:hypothetical protein
MMSLRSASSCLDGIKGPVATSHLFNISPNTRAKGDKTGTFHFVEQGNGICYFVTGLEVFKL